MNASLPDDLTLRIFGFCSAKCLLTAEVASRALRDLRWHKTSDAHWCGLLRARWPREGPVLCSLRDARPRQLFRAASTDPGDRDVERSRASLEAYERERAANLALGCIIVDADSRAGDHAGDITKRAFFRTAVQSSSEDSEAADEATAAFVAYCGYKGARGAAPFVDGRLVLPGLLSGLMWAAAQTCWFVANDALSMSVAFPLITSGPGVVSAAWGVLVFKEIKGARNYLVLALAVSLTIAGCVMIGLSKA